MYVIDDGIQTDFPLSLLRFPVQIGFTPDLTVHRHCNIHGWKTGQGGCWYS